MKLKFLSAVFAASLVAASSHAAEVTVHGSTTVDSNLFKPHMAKVQELSGLNVKVVANGSSRGIKGIDSGKADVGMISSSLDSVLAKLKLTDRAAEFKAEKVGEERIIFAVHPSNKVASLSKEQVVGILNGSIKNWSEVGGDAKPIVVVTEYDGGGFRTTIEKKLLSKSPMTAPKLKAMPNGSQVVKVGQQIPMAFVTIPSTMFKGSSLKKVETEAEIVQPLFLVVKGEGSEAFNKLVEAAKKVLSN